MSRLGFTRRCWSAVRMGVLSAYIGLMIGGAPTLAWGAGKKPAAFTPPEPKSYTMMYMATIIVIAGGVAIVCLPSRRKKEVE